VAAWYPLVDDTGFPEEGHAFGGSWRASTAGTSRETRQLPGSAVSSVGGDVGRQSADCPIALSCRRQWAEMAGRRDRRRQVPERGSLSDPSRRSPWIRSARAQVAARWMRGVVLADAAYGINNRVSRRTHSNLGLRYVVGVQSTMIRLGAGQTAALPSQTTRKNGRPPRYCSELRTINPFR